MPPEDYLEILRFRHYTHFWNFESKGKNSRRKSIINSRFRHYTHFWNFESKGKNSRRKSIINSIEVSVILHLVTVDSF